jgi:outer membrane scaffolding protein for murein synthesis (MipA/OmpV family)
MGLKDTNDTYQGGVFAKYRISLFSFGLSMYRAIGSLQGSGYYSPSIGFFLPLSRQFFINFGMSARYDDAQYMRALFGIDTAESEASGLPLYKTHAGWQNVSYTITPIWMFAKNWSLSGIFSAKNFANEPLASPIIEHGTTYFAGISLMRQLS